MTFEIPLVDALSIQADCMYLSDLRYLDKWQRVRLARILEQLPADAASLEEWNNALQYLAQQPPEETAAAARERLIQSSSSLNRGGTSLGTLCPQAMTKEKQEDFTTRKSEYCHACCVPSWLLGFLNDCLGSRAHGTIWRYRRLPTAMISTAREMCMGIGPS